MKIMSYNEFIEKYSLVEKIRDGLHEEEWHAIDDAGVRTRVTIVKVCGAFGCDPDYVVIQ